MHMYQGYHLWGMHLIWWFFWVFILIWIFATPWDVPGQMKKKDSPLDILQKRFASGAITTEQYHDQRAILRNDITVNHLNNAK